MPHLRLLRLGLCPLAACATVSTGFVPAKGQRLGRPVQEQMVGPTGFTLAFRCRDPNAPDAPDTASGLPP